ncbi:hypothetical protein CVT25_011543 [Psilocybe cyanescens]|uniref:Uncharacterized protein n=1 Tax=Psilocybe cyanescens TaxID=93625 RepID=A0A409XCB6_PSICY|nr:hypothetical protein CVT25_011543 [Psilocybe cyanescens]
MQIRVSGVVEVYRASQLMFTPSPASQPEDPSRVAGPSRSTGGSSPANHLQGGVMRVLTARSPKSATTVDSSGLP